MLSPRCFPVTSRFWDAVGLKIAGCCRLWFLFCCCTTLVPPLSAQSVRYEGEVVNRGYATNPNPSGTSATLELTASSAAGADGYVSIGPTLGGSGAFSYALWSDSILIVTTSPTADTIAWLGNWSPLGGAGFYIIEGGPYKGQGGSWSLHHVEGPQLARTARPPARIRERLSILVEPFGRIPQYSRKNPFVPPAISNPSAGTMSPLDSQVGSGSAVGYWIFFGLFALVAAGALVGWFQTRPVVPPGGGKTSPATPQGRRRKRIQQYAISCPVCGVERIEVAHKLWFMHGFILVARYGTRTIVGCAQCVRQKSVRELAVNAVGGWWCFPWGIGTPAVIVQNLILVLLGSRANEVEAVLRAAGIDPSEVKLDQSGLTREQRRLLRAAGHVLATVVWADGKIAPKEHARALIILQQFAGGRITPERAAQFFHDGQTWTGDLSDLDFDLRETLLQMALDIALADGELALPEIAILHDLAKRLGFPPKAVESMLDQVFGRRPAGEPSGSSRESRQRRRPAGVEEVARAAAILGVAVTATMVEVKQAWRSAMMRYHPDRSRGDRNLEAEFTKRSQEINWAHEILKRHATAEVYA